MKNKTLVVTLCILGAVPIDGKALADVDTECRNGGVNKVCGCAVFDNVRVNLYFRGKMPGLTHYNFKTNPGAQIELKRGYYSFKPNRGARGTYSVQACKRGGFGQRSQCSNWATFSWNSQRAEAGNCLSRGEFAA